MRGTPEEALLESNEAFYDAFAARDLDAMDELWAHATPVACVHPGWPPLHGRAEVMSSWRSILLGGDAPAITCESPAAVLLGSVGFVTCFERIGDDRLAATNVFALEDGVWQLVLHHAGGIAPEAAAPPDQPLN